MADLTEQLVALQMTPHLGERALARALDGRAGRIDGAFEASEEALRRDYGFHPQAARHFARHREKLLDDAQMLLVSLHRSGADALSCADPRYPDRLRHLPDAPPLLYAAGDLGLLDIPSLCFLASTGAARPALDRLRALADRAAGTGSAIVTGHNRDAFQAAALAAAQASSPVIYVLDCGLFTTAAVGPDAPFPAARIHPAAQQRRLSLSPFRPKDPWIGHNGRKRDHLIAVLAHVLVAVDLRPGGVMEQECRMALGRKQRVIALAAEGRIPEAHGRLFDMGALLIQTEEELIRHLWDAGFPGAGSASPVP